MARKVTVTVTNHGSDCTAYYIFEYKLTADTGYTQLPTQPTASFEINNLQDCQTYDYRITRFCCDGGVSTTATGTFSTCVPLSAVTGFTATGGNEQMTLEWDNMPTATNYVIERDTNPAFTSPTEVYNGAHTASYVDDPLSAATTYYYRIASQAVGYADSPYAYADDSTFDQLETPVNFVALGEDNNVALIWDADPDADTYVIERALDAGFTMSLTTVYTGGAITYGDGSVTNGVQYFYRLHAEATGFTNSGYAYDDATPNP